MESKVRVGMWSASPLLVDHAIEGVPSVLASLTKRHERRDQIPGDRVRPASIRVNAVSPGIIKTPMHGGGKPRRSRRPTASGGHMGEVQDIVAAVLYLDSANFVTGEILHVDGGQSAGH